MWVLVFGLGVLVGVLFYRYLFIRAIALEAGVHPEEVVYLLGRAARQERERNVEATQEQRFGGGGGIRMPSGDYKGKRVYELDTMPAGWPLFGGKERGV